MTFFKAVLAEYLRLRGADIPSGEGIIGLDEPPRAEEREDAYLRYAGKASRAPSPRRPRLSEPRHARALLHLPRHDGFSLRLGAPGQGPLLPAPP